MEDLNELSESCHCNNLIVKNYFQQLVYEGRRIFAPIWVDQEL